MSTRIRITTKDHVATLSMTRPEAHNAFDDVMIAEMTEALESLAINADVHTVLLSGEGKNFCAGADIHWMKRAASYTEAENLRDAEALAKLMSTLDLLPKTTVAKVHGLVFGGGVGLVACCDVVVATEDAKFCLSEVKLGIIPAVISPYIVSAIGARASRRYFQTAELFDAKRAQALGLVHEVTTAEQLDQETDRILAALRLGAPGAKTSAKTIIATVSNKPVDDDLIAVTAVTIARLRSQREAKEGLSAFIERRKPAWVGNNG